MEMHSLIDMLLAVIATGFGWWANNTTKEVKRLEILLNRTREEYATRGELKEDMSAEETCNLVRALTKPYPGAWIRRGGKKIRVWGVS